MANSINSNYFMQYQTAQFSRTTTAAGNAAEEKFSATSFGVSATFEFSEAGLNALADAKNTVDAAATDEGKLSAKAQSYLENLRKKYGDYDFFVSNNPDAAQTVGSTKEYSVILTTEELEKMAEDDEYAEKVMGQVGSAVDKLNEISSKDLGEGVKFAQLSVSIDSEGHMKFFAQLEKLSDEQNARLEAAREKRAEEKAKADEKAKPEENTQPDENELTKILFKPADVEADSEEELLAKILGIDWDNIAEEEAYI